MLNIGSAIKECRELQELTLQEIAEKSGLTKSYLSRVENAQRDPTINTLEKISLALNIPLNILILLSEDESKMNDKFDEINLLLKKAIMEKLKSGKKLGI